MTRTTASRGAFDIVYTRNYYENDESRREKTLHDVINHNSSNEEEELTPAVNVPANFSRYYCRGLECYYSGSSDKDSGGIDGGRGRGGFHRGAYVLATSKQIDAPSK